MKLGSLLLYCCLLLSFVTTSQAAEIQLGQTFDIAEPDMLAEIEQRAANVDWQAEFTKRPMSQHSAFQTAALPAASENSSRLFDPTYRIPRDIADRHGKILFAKGTPVNAYDRVTMPGRVIVIGPQGSHIDWLKNVAKPQDGDKLLLAGGNILELRKSSGQRLYAVDDRIIERFNLKATPTVVTQEGNQLRITEYALD